MVSYTRRRTYDFLSRPRPSPSPPHSRPPELRSTVCSVLGETATPVQTCRRYKATLRKIFNIVTYIISSECRTSASMKTSRPSQRPSSPKYLFRSIIENCRKTQLSPAGLRVAIIPWIQMHPLRTCQYRRGQGLRREELRDTMLSCLFNRPRRALLLSEVSASTRRNNKKVWHRQELLQTC